jgi:hypothetical protein
VEQFLNPPSPIVGVTGTSDHRQRAGGGMAGMLDTDRSRTRRERTFVGTECAVCEEPLEHTLRGERVLQFSCGHVSHEACFYEYIKEFESQYCPTCNAPLGLDTSRGGNILDIGKDPHDGSLSHTRWLISLRLGREAEQHCAISIYQRPIRQVEPDSHADFMGWPDCAAPQRRVKPKTT